MSLFRCCALGGGLALIAMLFSNGLAEGQVQRQPIQIQPGAGRALTGPLVPAEVQEKLALTKEQKEKIEKIEKEYGEKAKDTEAKMKEAREKAVADKNREALAKVREMAQDAQKVRGEFEDKVKAVLTDEQKKKLEEAKPAVRPGIRPVPGNVQPGKVQPIPIQRGGGQPNLTQKNVQDQLNLTAEQKEKLEKLQKDFEEQSNGVLTKEQKEKFEELKKQPARPRVRPPVPN